MGRSAWDDWNKFGGLFSSKKGRREGKTPEGRQAWAESVSVDSEWSSKIVGHISGESGKNRVKWECRYCGTTGSQENKANARKALIKHWRERCDVE